MSRTRRELLLSNASVKAQEIPHSQVCLFRSEGTSKSTSDFPSVRNKNSFFFGTIFFPPLRKGLLDQKFPKYRHCIALPIRLG